MNLVELRSRLEEEATRERALELGGRGRLSLHSGALAVEASSRQGRFDTNTNAVAASQTILDDTVGVGVFLGNQKDAGSAVAAGACALALLESLDEPWRSSADIVPSLRRFVLRAHDWIGELTTEPLGGVYPTLFGPRRTLEGIGAAALAVVVRPHGVEGIHVGDARSYLIREGEVRALTLPHTLDRMPGQRGLDPLLGAEHVVVRVLGLAEPEADVFRLALQPGDALVLGNQALDAELLRRHWPHLDALDEAMQSGRPDLPPALVAVRPLDGRVAGA